MKEEKQQEKVMFCIPEGIDNIRIDKALANHFSDFSRESLQGIFEGKLVWVNGEAVRKSFLVKEGDKVELYLPEAKVISVFPVKLPIEVLYEDEDIIVVNKMAGQVVHPGSGTGDNTLVHGLLHYTKGKLSAAGGELRPGVVHRLDKETSGVIVFAKTDKAYFRLIEYFAERTIKKQYITLVEGNTRLLAGSIKMPIDRNKVNRVKMCVVQEGGREALTDWEVKKAFKKSKISLLNCWPHTGRTHQIRVHLSAIGHPILGDRLYGAKFYLPEDYNIGRVMLHAEELELHHPINGKEMRIKAPLPKDFKLCIEKLSTVEAD